MKNHENELNEFRWWRFFIDMLFVCIVIKIVSEMFSGIITDRFGELRGKLNDI